MTAGSDIVGPVERAKELLRHHGYDCKVSADDMSKWFRTNTRHADIGLEAVLRNSLLVVHEVVEIDAVKRMGMSLAKDVIVRNPERTAEAHLMAAEVELEVAVATEDYGHIANRLHDMKAWCLDPSMPRRLRHAYSELCAKATRILGTSEPERPGPSPR